MIKVYGQRLAFRDEDVGSSIESLGLKFYGAGFRV